MMIEESLYEFSKRGRPKKGKKSFEKLRGINTPDSWNDLEDEEIIDDIDVDTSDMVNTEDIEVEESGFNDDNYELQMALTNELEMKEISRRTLTFSLKQDPEKILNGVPMAKMGNGEAFLFKLDDDKLKKIFLKDIIVEHQKRKNDRAFTINE